MSGKFDLLFRVRVSNNFFSLSLSLSRLVSFGPRPLFYPPVLVSNGNSQASFFSLISFSSTQGF